MEAVYSKLSLFASPCLLVACVLSQNVAYAGIEDAKRWIEKEFQESTLSREQQMAEMEWEFHSKDGIAVRPTRPEMAVVDVGFKCQILR